MLNLYHERGGKSNLPSGPSEIMICFRNLICSIRIPPTSFFGNRRGTRRSPNCFFLVAKGVVAKAEESVPCASEEATLLRLHRLFPLLLLAMAATICVPRSSAQALVPTGLPVWDSTNQVLFFGYGAGPPDRSVRGYVDARQRGADIDISKEFPGLQAVVVDGLTAGPDDTTMIATILEYEGRHVRRAILTYSSRGRLLRAWDPAPQSAEAIAYSKDDDAVFVLGDRDIPDGPNAPNYPLLVEYSREGQVLKSMVPANTLQDRGDSFWQGGEIGQPVLRVTRDRIYFYAPTNREVVACDRNGVVLAYRSISDIVEKISTRDGNHLVQIHQVDFSDDGNIVLELLVSDNRGYALEVFRINIKTGEAVSVHKAFNGTGLFFIGVKDGQYLYIENGRTLYVQSDENLEPIPLTTAEKQNSPY